VDEKTREEIEEFTEETDNHPLKDTNIDSSTNVLGMDKIYRLGDVNPAVDPSDAHDDIIRKGLNNKHSWGNPHDDIKELQRELEETIKNGTELNQKMPEPDIVITGRSTNPDLIAMSGTLKYSN
jgi:hypothetical protein